MEWYLSRHQFISNDSFPNFLCPDAAPGDQCDGGLPPPSPGQVVRGEGVSEGQGGMEGNILKGIQWLTI